MQCFTFSHSQLSMSPRKRTLITDFTKNMSLIAGPWYMFEEYVKDNHYARFLHAAEKVIFEKVNGAWNVGQEHRVMVCA